MKIRAKDITGSSIVIKLRKKSHLKEGWSLVSIDLKTEHKKELSKFKKLVLKVQKNVQKR